MVARALGAHRLLKNQAQKTSVHITARMVADLSRVAAPVIYPANADKIGLLGPDAMDVVIIYSLIELARAGVSSLEYHRTPDDIPAANVAKVAEVFLEACEYAQGVLPK